MILVHEIRIQPHQPESLATEKALALLKIPAAKIASAQVHKLSVDARRGKPVFVYSIALRLQDPGQEKKIANQNKKISFVEERLYVPVQPGTELLQGPIVVCGLGPAGLFAALELAQAGYTPLVIERGPDMERRRARVRQFEQGGALDEDANVQFGEGGAGTFSDGKLTTRIKDPLCRRVTECLLEAGAPPEIAWRARPHIGTDRLQTVFTVLRNKIIQYGGRVLFDTKLDSICINKRQQIQSISTSKGDFPCGVLILATGHSARDCYAMLDGRGIELQAKPFSVGVRIEHLQATIDKGLYHEAAGHPALPPGEYQLSTKTGGRGVYTFCMCPGGTVVAAASEKNTVLTNGMSLYARNQPNANAAVVVGVDGRDFEENPFRAIQFQRDLERTAFVKGGGSYTAPAETLGSFLEGRGLLEFGEVEPTYPRGISAFDLGALLPAPVTEGIRGALRKFGRQLPGFDRKDALLTGVETRTSSPVRIPRKENLENLNLEGLYPCGEGAGYAGGIMSAAVDGLRVARAIIGRYSLATEGRGCHVV